MYWADVQALPDSQALTVSFWTRTDGPLALPGDYAPAATVNVDGWPAGALFTQLFFASMPSFPPSLVDLEAGTAYNTSFTASGYLQEAISSWGFWDSINDVWSAAWVVGQDGVGDPVYMSPSDGDWHHVLYALLLTPGVGFDFKLTIDGAPITIDPGKLLVAVSEELQDLGMFWNDSLGLLTPPEGALSELWMALGVQLDVHDPDVIAKFRSGAGKPVNLGASGQRPTGSPPTYYLVCDSATFGANSGTAQGFTLLGGSTAVTAAPDSPSD